MIPSPSFLATWPPILDRRRGRVEIAADEIAPVLGVEFRGDAGRADEVAEHHGQVAALGGVLLERGRRKLAGRDGRRRAEIRDGLQQALAMPQQNSELFQVANVEIGQSFGIDAIVTKDRLVLAEP